MGLFICKIELELCIEADSEEDARQIFWSALRPSLSTIRKAEGLHDLPTFHEHDHRPWRRWGQLSAKTCAEIIETTEAAS